MNSEVRRQKEEGEEEGEEEDDNPKLLNFLTFWMDEDEVVGYWRFKNTIL